MRTELAEVELVVFMCFVLEHSLVTAVLGINHYLFVTCLLPPAYVVRREGNSFTLLVCLHPGGVPISHNALQHFPECHGAAGGGVPRQVQLGGYPGRGVPWLGGGIQVGQQKEYSLHGGRYASCIHAGGLSCYFYNSTWYKTIGRRSRRWIGLYVDKQHGWSGGSTFHI